MGVEKVERYSTDCMVGNVLHLQGLDAASDTPCAIHLVPARELLLVPL